MNYTLGQKVVHPLYGIGKVVKCEEKTISGKATHFQTITFQNDRLKIMLNSEQKNAMIRTPIEKQEIPKVLRFLENCKPELPVKSPERYNINLKKIKSSDIYQLAEVIKDLNELSKVKKLSPKEQSMLKQSKKLMAAEFSMVMAEPEDRVERVIDSAFRGKRKKMKRQKGSEVSCEGDIGYKICNN